MANIGILKVKKLIDSLLIFVKQDYEDKLANNISDESFLIRCFDSEDIADDISYKDLAVEIFTRGDQESRKVETRLMYDRERASLPTIHVREPAKGKGKQDSIGYIDEDLFINSDLSYNQVRRRSFDSNFELLITSFNRHEVLIMEEVILALLIGAQDTLALASPFYQFSFNIKELMANNELVPDILFIKSIGLNVSYNKTYPDISNNNMLNSILFKANILS